MADDAIAKANDLPAGVIIATASPDHIIDAIPAVDPITDVDSTDVQTKATVPSGYVVVTSQAETSVHTQDLINSLREAGVHDLQEVDYGSYKGMIMLGYYYARSYAEKRRTGLADLGFTSEIYERY